MTRLGYQNIMAKRMKERMMLEKIGRLRRDGKNIVVFDGRTWIKAPALKAAWFRLREIVLGRRHL